jgi:flagellin-like hook-associated protein FlgL
MADITLSAGIRNNLLALSSTKDLIGRTQNRLATGLNVSSPIDDAVKYFQAKTLSDRANDLNDRKSAIDQGVSTVTTAVDAMTSMGKLLKQMKGVIDSARSGSAVERKEYGKQIATLATQINKLVNDASYKGLNLINSSASNLTVYFSEKSDSKLTVGGVQLQVSGLYLDSAGAVQSAKASFLAESLSAGSQFIKSALGFLTALSGYSMTAASVAAAQLNLFNSQADAAIVRLDKTIANLQAKAATMGSSVAILNVRLDFTKTYINTLSGGADKLTVADLNSEGANLVALQTRQQMGVQSLAFAGQMDQSVLKLLG